MPNANRISEAEQRRLDAFLQLTRMERGLRRFIERELTKCDGPRWANALPGDVKEKVLDRGLDHTDFPDLKKVIGSSWTKLGAAVDGMKKTQVLNHLEGLESIRNDVAHSREVSTGAAALISAAYYVLQPIALEDSRQAALPPTEYPAVALDRARAAVQHVGPVAADDVRVLSEQQGCDELCAAIESYERVRSRPGRQPSLMAEVKADAEARLAEVAAAGISKAAV